MERIINTKKCNKCEKEQDISQFNFCKSTKDKLTTYCKSCLSEQRKIRYLKNKEHELEINRQWREKNLEKFKSYLKQWHEENKERIKEKNNEPERKTIIKKRHKIYIEKNKDKIRNLNSKWKEKNREKIRHQNREREKLLLKNNLGYKAYKSIRRRIALALEDAGANKNNHRTIEYIGCSIEFYIKYQESLWTEGMTWENYGNGKGKWQIDHIKPCCSFNLTIPEEQLKCFHYSNTQPLWHKEHVIKTTLDKKLSTNYNNE